MGDPMEKIVLAAREGYSIDVGASFQKLVTEVCSWAGDLSKLTNLELSLFFC